jgi:hypothetical protein
MPERDRVMQSLVVDGSLAVYEVTAGEALANETFTRLILASREYSSVINLDILLATERIASERHLLENAGFTFAGTHQLSRDGHPVLVAKFRICVKTNDLAVPTPQLAPSHEERAAQLLMQERYGKPSC